MNDRQREIYSRQIILPGLGEAGQERLLASSVLICGVGGLGAPVALYLTAMGVGRLGLVDGDQVAWSNLNRQLLYTPADVGRAKVQAAAERLRQLNPELKIETHQMNLTEENAAQLVSGYDIAADCLDNFAGRFILNDACLAMGVPFVHAGVRALSGQTMTVLPGRGPCLRCLLPGGHSDDKGPWGPGIIGATAGVLGSLQAQQIYKYLAGLAVDEGLLVYDGGCGEWQRIAVPPDPQCACRNSVLNQRSAE